MNALIGTPTLFNGTEFFQTGYETKSKNQSQDLQEYMETVTRCLAKQEPWYGEDATNGDGESV